VKAFRQFLLRNRITPKWAIFALDLSLCIFAILYSNYFLAGLKSDTIHFKSLIDDVFLTALASSCFFTIFRTYQGIIRFSDFNEAVRSISAVLYAALSLLIINSILSFVGIAPLIETQALLIFFFIASFLIFGYRLLVKHLYRKSIGEENLVNVIIYGAELSGAFLKTTVEHLTDKPYRVVAFIEDEDEYIWKSIDNILIHPYQNINSLIGLHNVKAVLFAKDNLVKDIKKTVVDICLTANVKVMNVPPIRDWVHGNLNISQLKEVKIEELLGRPSIELPNEHVVNTLKRKQILITGAAGSIGSELARQIAGIGPLSLIICDKSETGLYDLEYELQQMYKLGDTLKVVLGDVKDEYAMNRLFATHLPNIVFHAAAYKHVPMMEKHPSEAILNNVLGTKMLADLAELYRVEKFLFVSTDKAINPTNIMGASKRIAEVYCHALQARSESELQVVALASVSREKKKTKFITTRFGNVMGSNGSVIPRFQAQISAGGPVTVTHPEIIRYFMTIQEACSLVLEAVTIGNGGELYLFDMGEPVKILDLAKKMIQLSGKDIRIEFTGLRPGEKLFEELLNKAEEVIPTHHKKILIAKAMEFNYASLLPGIDTLIELAQVNNDENVVKQIKNLVPEYTTSNPVYEIMEIPIPSRVASGGF